MAEKSRAMDAKSKVAQTVDPDIAVEPGDMELLATLGYKQELRRHYSTTQIFAVAFSIMGLLPSIASTLSFSLPAGPVGMVWVNYLHELQCGFLKGPLTSDRDGSLQACSSLSLAWLWLIWHPRCQPLAVFISGRIISATRNGRIL